MKSANVVTVKFTLEFTRTLELTQNDKPNQYSNLEWAKQQIENVCHEAEFMADGSGKECYYTITKGALPDEICED